jgi:hypothetical protein
LGTKTHFQAGRHENKEKLFFYFGLLILLPSQIQFLDIENPKNQKNRLLLFHMRYKRNVLGWLFRLGKKH